MTSGYRKIASGIAVVAFLTLMYFALIPGGTLALSSVTAVSGDPIIGAFVKLVDYPQYNATTVGPDGQYSIQNVPYDGIAGGSTYTIRTRATGYALNTTTVFVNGPSVAKDIALSPGVRYIASGQIYAGQWRTDFRVGNLGTQPTTLDTNFLNLLGVSKNASEDVISVMSSKDYVWSEKVTIPHGDGEGSGTISSEQPIDVITMQRSNSAGKLGFFEGTPLNVEGTEWFVPGLIYAGQWRSGFKILNLGNVDADVTIYFYNSTGSLINTLPNRTIPSKTSPYYDWYTYGYIAGGSTASSADGTATIISNNGQPLSVLGNQASELQGSLGFWNGIYQNEQKTDIFVTGQIWSGSWRSGFKVANLDSSDADVTMYFYNSLGNQINVLNNVIIKPKASPYYDWYTYGFLASGSLPSAADGTVRVVSNNGRQLYITESQASESAGMLDFYPAVEINGNKTAGLIYQKFEGGERSGFKVANPGSSPVTATIRFYNSTGALVNTISGSSISAKSSPYYAWASYTTEPYGSVTVDASDRISVIANFASNTEAKLGIYKGVKEQ